MENKNAVFSISGELVGVYKTENGLPMITVNSNGHTFDFGVYTLGLMKSNGMHASDGTLLCIGDLITVFGEIDDCFGYGIVLYPEKIMKLL